MERIIILLIFFQFLILLPIDASKGKSNEKQNKSNLKTNHDKQSVNVDKSNAKENLKQKKFIEGKNEMKDIGQSTFLDFLYKIAVILSIPLLISILIIRKNFFNREFRGIKARDQAPVGAGIGLFMVKKILDLHRGTIELIPTDHPNRFVFKIILPKNEGKNEL